MNNYGENMILATDSLIEAKISTLRYDTTLSCTVIGLDEDTHHYWVNSGTAKMLVGPRWEKDEYERTDYKIDDKVLVLIPNGDLSSSSKMITGIAPSLSTNDYKSIVEKNASTFSFVPQAYATINTDKELSLDAKDTNDEGFTICNSMLEQIDSIVLPTDTTFSRISFSFELLTSDFPVNSYITADKPREYEIGI